MGKKGRGREGGAGIGEFPEQLLLIPVFTGE